MPRPTRPSTKERTALQCHPAATLRRATVPDADRVAELRTVERQLQAAQRASDIAELDRLIDDRLLFTGPGGKLYTKADDLRMHATGEQKITRVDEEQLSVLVVGDTGITCFLGTLEGTLLGSRFTARIRYTRTWIHNTDSWRLLAVHVSDVA
jgi:ketosteroid isomerase-like protein